MGIIWTVGSLVFLTLVFFCNNSIGNVHFSWFDLKKKCPFSYVSVVF
jgi:hypothetical protein